MKAKKSTSTSGIVEVDGLPKIHVTEVYHHYFENQNPYIVNNKIVENIKWINMLHKKNN
jgi:hypothetical protein